MLFLVSSFPRPALGQPASDPLEYCVTKTSTCAASDWKYVKLDETMDALTKPFNLRTRNAFGESPVITCN